MATSTTQSSTTSVNSNLQASKFKLLKELFSKVKDNWKSIAAFIAGEKILSELDSLPKILGFLSNVFQPNISPEYKTMTEYGKQSVNRDAANLTQAFLSNDRAGVISSLQSIADTYETQSKIVTNPSEAKALQDKAQHIRGMSGLFESGKPLDPGITDKVKGLDKQEVNASPSNGDKTLEQLNQNLEKLVVKALVQLGFNEISSTNSRQVAGELLSMGASPDIAKQALTYYYGENLGLTKTQSVEEAAKSVAGAVADKETGITTMNAQESSTKVTDNQREM